MLLHVVQFVLCFCLQLVGQFIARAVSDQILSESYIDGYKGRVNCEYTRYVTYLCSSDCYDKENCVLIYLEFNTK